MRVIDADHLKRWIISRGLKSQLHPADIIDQIDREPTIEPRCEECEAFNKTRLLIPQPERKKGKWINIREGNRADCDQCGQSGRAWMNFCFDCGADMREDAEEPKKCDNCRHEKSQWFNRCADCFDYELWEGKTNDQNK